MKIVPAVEAEIRREVRDARAVDPRITVSGLEQLLEKKFNRGFSYKYVAKLVDKIGRQAFTETDRTTIEERLAFTRENHRIVREHLMKIAMWQNQAKTIVMLDLALQKAEIDNGLYKRPIEDVTKDFRYEPLPGEVRAVIVAAWQRGGLLRAATVEKIVPGLTVHQ